MSGDSPTDRDDDSATETAPPPEFNVRRLIRRALLIGLVVLIALVAVSTLPGLSAVRERFTNARPAWLLAPLGLKLGVRAPLRRGVSRRLLSPPGLEA